MRSQFDWFGFMKFSLVFGPLFYLWIRMELEARQEKKEKKEFDRFLNDPIK